MAMPSHRICMFTVFIFSIGLEAVILSEDIMMSGFVPLLTTPLTSTFVEDSVDKVNYSMYK
jgi:hypothetical protein